MIPSLRLIITAALLTPLGLLPALAPLYAMPAAGLVCLIVLIVIADLILCRQRLDHLSLIAPEVVRMTQHRPATVSLHCLSSADRPSKLSAVLSLPPALQTDHPSLDFPAPGLKMSQPLSWQTVASQRGRFQLSQATLVTSSRLGFWEIRKLHDLKTEIRVYPNLISDRHSLASLFLPQMREGRKTRRQIGQGREFEKLRDYIAGDSLDRIHWKATAKRNKPMSKVFQVERTQEIYVLIDSSRLSGIPVQMDGNGQQPLLELSMKTAMLTGLAAQQQGDLFGLCTFSSRVNTFLRAKGGKGHFNHCREQLYLLETEPVSPDFQELATFIGQRLRKRAMLIILTNLDDPVLAEEFAVAMELINRRHLILVAAQNPPWARPLFTDDQLETIDDIHKNLAGHIQDQRLRTLEKQLKNHGVKLLRPSAEKQTVQVIQEYMQIKERQRL